MLSHTDGEGGESLLVDGFDAAAQLFRLHPKAYQCLSSARVHWHASGNDDVSIQPHAAFPVLNHHPGHGNIMQVRWNNADRAGFDIGLGAIDSWYRAAK